MSELIAVTGATGHLGGRVARQLAERGVPQRLVVRDPARTPLLDAAEVAIADYTDPGALRAAFTGVGTLFFVSGHASERRLDVHLGVVAAARTPGCAVSCTRPPSPRRHTRRSPTPATTRTRSGRSATPGWP